jgi:hypothetical protein
MATRSLAGLGPVGSLVEHAFVALASVSPSGSTGGSPWGGGRRPSSWSLEPVERWFVAGEVPRSAWVGQAATDPHRRRELWTCRVLPLVVLIRMPVVDSRPLLPPGSVPMP